MTNTMNTPIEVIENEYPILVTEYSLRDDSGGAGRFRGGLGIRRAFKVLSKATLSLTAERVKISPWGLSGGHDGARGEHYIVKASGEKLLLSGKDTAVLDEGDIVVINTPGGGGYGDPAQRDPEQVLEDVRDGKVSVNSALGEYPVKIVERGGELVVDFEETVKLRGFRR
jgi:N-methylhydantoinase B